MGLADRDDMRERLQEQQKKKSGAAPPGPPARATLWLVLLVIALFFVLFKAASWWQGRRAVPPAQPPAIAIEQMGIQPAAAPAPNTVAVPRMQPGQKRLDSIPAQTRTTTVTEVTRCIAEGGTSYSDGACPPGVRGTTVVTRSEVNVMSGPAVPAPAAAPAPAAVAAVPPPQPTAAPQPTEFRADAVASQIRQRECEALDGELQEWEDRARRPQSAQVQDHIREQERRLRGRKFELRC